MNAMLLDAYTWNEVKIRSIRLVAKDVVAVGIEKPAAYSYHVGQYAVVRANGVIRQYSFSSAPKDEELELLVQRQPGGTVSNWFHDTARSGMSIELSQAFGNFVPPYDNKEFVAIAGRVGVAPFLSMKRAGIRLPLLYAVRNRQEICFEELLDFSVDKIFVSEEDGHITAEDLLSYIKPDIRFYLCGSKRFVDRMFQKLESAGVTADRIRRELFTLE